MQQSNGKGKKQRHALIFPFLSHILANLHRFLRSAMLRVNELQTKMQITRNYSPISDKGEKESLDSYTKAILSLCIKVFVQ